MKKFNKIIDLKRFSYIGIKFGNAIKELSYNP